ncbi:class I SAM-dependent methyltransferase [Marinisporobacter balticus]|uniref:Methyltransferase family protein n=1 Tax=Marinisporobacter balticus TaxID=2018667 RepID=A0A4R2K6Y0_9FIRM|nr:class I SAM-dependent methyltransferase [Marinisporobacter balticus]TCO69063.1 methyltransferase family protein [Marinisporobacter balticus]
MTKDYYNKNAQDFVENTLKADMSKIYSRFEKHLKTGATLLDLGCGSGRDSLYFINKGYDVVATDYAEELVEHASQLLNHQVLQLDMRNLDFDDTFDAIWACASILHIPREEIVLVIRNCERALKKNGIFYLSFKYGDDETFRNGRFFNSYNEESFQSLMDLFPSLKIIDIWKTADVRVGREEEQWLNIIVEKNMLK